MTPELIPLSRALTKLGYCSRSRAADYIKSGRVSVNGEVTRLLSSRVDLDRDIIAVDRNRLSRPVRVVIMLHKPRGFVTTSSDEFSRKTVYGLIPNDLHLFSVGRLDIDTTGLLLFTNDGTLQDKILSPENEIAKTYIVTVNGKVTGEQIGKLMKGVEIRDGVICRADDCEIVETELSKTRLRIRIHEGKNREIRRMLDAIGKKVSRLHRTAIGGLELDVPEGAWRKLTDEEIKLILN
ncbi:MAG TPA: pseudouridine synthase [Candidatus Acidoferrales bacterium]|nr:pseudouridine synthase [Candidatus Acidoferrales bacterium]